MKLSKKYLLIGLACAASFASAYEEDHEAHNFAQLSWVREDPKDEDVTPTGLGVLVRVDLNDHWFVRGEYEDLADGGVDVQGAEIALAYVLNPHKQTAFHIAGVYGFEKETEASLSAKEYGRGMEVGFHSRLTSALTLHGETALITGGGEETLGGALGLFYGFSEHLGANVEYLFDEDENSAIEVGFRFSF